MNIALLDLQVYETSPGMLNNLKIEKITCWQL